jgi:predicted outer membrane repeat protein
LQVELPSNVYVLRADGTGDFEGLNAAVAAVESGDVIELEPGEYWGGTYEDPINMNVPIEQMSLTIRSTTGNPADVVLTFPTVPKGGLRVHGAFTVSGATLVLEGVTVRYAQGDVGFGAALNAAGSDVTIRNCAFDRCFIWVHGAGGALYLTGSTVLMEGCEFRDCYVGNSDVSSPGGAIFSESTDLRLRNTRFHDNGSVSGAESGGAIHAEGAGTLFLQACAFERNAARDGGAIYCAAETDLSVADCVFLDGLAARGGAIHGAGLIRGCVIARNVGYFYGGGIYVPIRDGFETIIEQCTLHANLAETGSSLYHSNPGGATAIHIKESILALGVTPDDPEGPAEIFVETGGCGLEWECSTLFTEIDPGTTPCVIEDGFFAADPLFCDEATFSLRSDSPCLAENNPCGRTMGAVPGVGCNP